MCPLFYSLLFSLKKWSVYYMHIKNMFCRRILITIIIIKCIIIYEWKIMSLNAWFIIIRIQFTYYTEFRFLFQSLTYIFKFTNVTSNVVD